MGILDDANQRARIALDNKTTRNNLPFGSLNIPVIFGIICIVFLLAGIHFRLNSLEHSQDFEAGKREEQRETARYLLHHYGEENVLRYWEWKEKE